MQDGLRGACSLVSSTLDVDDDAAHSVLVSDYDNDLAHANDND